MSNDKMDETSDTDLEDDFPCVYYLDPEQGSPVTRRWSGLNSSHYYIDGTGMAQPYPDILGEPETSDAIALKPLALPRELTIDPCNSLDIDSSFRSGSLLSTRYTNTGDIKSTILQRRRYRLAAKNIKHPLMFFIHNKDQIDQPYLVTNIDRKEHEEAAGGDDYVVLPGDEENEYLDSIEDYYQKLQIWYAAVDANRLLPEDESWVWVEV